jgi:hypothetical protein
MGSVPLLTLDYRVKTSPYFLEILQSIDYNKLVKEVNDVIDFVSKNYSDFEALLDVVQDAEVSDWREVVLTIYLKAPVDEILELWDRLYDNVKIDNVVISLLPIPSHGWRF